MKLAHCLALMALLFVIVVTSINCVQNTTPQPSPAPASDAHSDARTDRHADLGPAVKHL